MLMDQVLVGLRPYTAGDIEKLAKLMTLSRAWPAEATPTVEEVLARWRRRNVQPEYDVSVLPGPSGELVAFSQGSVFKDGSARLGFEIVVHPEARGRGIGSALYRLLEE